MSIVARQSGDVAPTTASTSSSTSAQAPAGDHPRGAGTPSALHPGRHGRTTWRRAVRPAALVLADLALPLLAAAAVPALPGVVAGSSDLASDGLPAPLMATTLLWPLLLACTGWYAARTPRSERLLALAVVFAVLAWLVLRGSAGADAVTPEAVALVAAAAAVGTRSSRCVHGSWCTHRGLPRAGRARRAVLLGHPAAVRHLAGRLAGSPDIVVAGSCLLEEPTTTERSTRPAAHRSVTDAATVVGLPRLGDLLVWTRADEVVVLPCSHLEGPTLRRLGWELEGHGVDLVLATGLTGVEAARTRVTTAGDLPVVHVRHARLSGPQRVVKEVWERLAAVLALALLTPLLLGLMLAVRLDSRGPALFRQPRVGRDDRTFTMWKLRTMSVDAEQRRTELDADNEADDVLFKIREDPRVTRVGRVLRRTSLDELPQLVNIALGQMALVGPRPALPDEVAEYAPDVRRRLAVKPGLTGLWQVSGRSDLSWEESVRLDQHYVDNWSLRQDLTIVLRTVHAVVARRGAY